MGLLRKRERSQVEEYNAQIYEEKGQVGRDENSL